jgi:hypothetical protein
MLVAPMITPSEQESILYTVRILLSVTGFIIFCIGAILYLYVHIRDQTEAVARSGRGSDGSVRGRKL